MTIHTPFFSELCLATSSCVTAFDIVSLVQMMTYLNAIDATNFPRGGCLCGGCMRFERGRRENVDALYADAAPKSGSGDWSHSIITGPFLRQSRSIKRFPLRLGEKCMETCESPMSRISKDRVPSHYPTTQTDLRTSDRK